MCKFLNMDLKIHEVCRACMNTKNDYLNDEDFREMSSNLREMFTFCTTIQILNDDGLPLNLCQQCTENIQTCYNFINICKTTDETLKDYVTQSKDEKKTLKLESIVNEGSLVIGNIKVENEEGYSGDENVEIYPDFENTSADFIIEDKGSIIKQPKKKKYKKNKTEDSLKVKLKKKKIRLKDDEWNRTGNALKNKNTFTCPVCNVVITGRNHFTRHLNREHEEFKRFICNYCEKGFTKSHYLHQHEITHKRERPFKCEICDKTYKHRGQLTTHKRVHSSDRPYGCDDCPLTFNTKCSMTAHRKLHHGEEPNLCHLCGASFAQVGNLRVHMRTHTGEKPYSCSICPFKCSVQSGMKRHERMHANLKLHKCPVCQKGFNNNGSMIRHLRIHTGELPYKCDYCPKAFVDNWKRKNHLVKSHNIALETIPKMIPGRKKRYMQENATLQQNTNATNKDEDSKNI